MRKRMEKGWKERVKQLNKRGRRQEWDTICQKTMEQSRTNKSLQCCFLYLIYSQLSRPNNEGWSLLMLTARDNFGLQLHPKRLEDGQISFYRPPSQEQWQCGKQAWTKLHVCCCLMRSCDDMWCSQFTPALSCICYDGEQTKSASNSRKNVFNVQKFLSFYNISLYLGVTKCSHDSFGWYQNWSF